MALSATAVQSTKGNTGNAVAASLSLTLGAAPTVGNYLIVGAVVGASTGGITLVQTNVTWLYYGAFNGIPLVAWLGIGRILPSAGTGLTIALGSAATFAGAAVLAEFTGVNLLPDRGASASGNSTSPASGATSTTSVANELEIGVLASRGTFNAATTVFSSPTNSFSIVDQDNSTVNNADRAVALLVKLVTSTGTANAGATISSQQWAAQVMTFQEGGGSSRGRML